MINSTIETIETEPAVPDVTSTALAQFSEFRSAIATVKPLRNLTVAADGINAVEEGHKAVKALRIKIDKRRKELNEAALSHQRAVNTTAKELTAEIAPIEGALEAQREEYESKKLKEKQDREKAKAAVLQERANRLAAIGCAAGDLASLAAMSGDDFEVYLQIEKEKSAARLAEEAAEKKRQAEAEAERLATLKEAVNAERLRLEAIRQQLAAQAAEDRRKAEAIAAEEKRKADESRRLAEAELADQRRKAAEELQVMRDKQEAERKALEAQQLEVARQQAEIRERLEAEKRAEETRERNAREAAELAAESARLEALRPEIEKAEAFGQSLMTDARDELTKLGNPDWSDQALGLIGMCVNDIVSMVKGRV